MVTYPESHLNRVFGALSDPTRRRLLAALAEGESTVQDLAAPFEMSRPAISKHLRVLEKAGLVRRNREGRYQQCRLEGGPLGVAVLWLDQYRQFWDSKLDRFQEYVENLDQGDPS